MGLAADIVRRIAELFPVTDRAEAESLIVSARFHDGRVADPRCQRCALVASAGSLDKLRYYVDLLAFDYRDVIVAGEYESRGGKLVRVRNLEQAF